LDGTCRGNATAFASTRVSNKAIPTASTEIRVEVFSYPRVVSARRVATRNEGKPDPCEVKQNEGKKRIDHEDNSCALCCNNLVQIVCAI